MTLDVFAVEPAAALDEGWTAPSPLVFASPHSGDGYPADMGARGDLAPFSLRCGEDALVDQLLEGCADLGAPLLHGRIGRAYVDLNRAPDELDALLIEGGTEAQAAASPRVRAGYGVIPRLGGDGAALYDRRLSQAEALDRIARVHTPYHRTLERLMRAAQARHGFAILVDWHSMPARATPGRGAKAVDVVVGDRHGSSCAAAITRRLRGLVEGAGWRATLNQPYAGGYATQLWGRPLEGLHAVQVELNRALYLDEARLVPSADFERTRRIVRRVAAGLAAHDWAAEGLAGQAA